MPRGPGSEGQYGYPGAGQLYDQAYGHPGYDQQSQYEPQPQYGQNGNPVISSSAHDQTQEDAQVRMDPAYGRPEAPPIPAFRKSNAMPWIIGGAAVGVVVLLTCGISGFFIVKSANSGGSGPHVAEVTSSASAGGEGRYDSSMIANLCDKIDSTPLKTALPAASDQDSNSGKHDETRGSYSTTLSCSFGYTSPQDSDTYVWSSGFVYAEFAESVSAARSGYDYEKKSAADQTGSGHTYGEIQGVGDAAFFTADTDPNVSYQLRTLSSNVEVTISLTMNASGASKPSIDTVKQTAITILKDTLTKLAK